MIDNEIQIFNFENNEVRTKLIDNELYFNLTDACKILKIKKTRKVKTRLDEKGVRTMDILTQGKIQKMNFISKPNIYKLSSQSREPQALIFAIWAIFRILPTELEGVKHYASSNPRRSNQKMRDPRIF